MPTIRTGRRNGHTLYLQLGEEPNDGSADPDAGDLFVGSCITPQVAALIADAATCGLRHHPALLEEFAGKLPPAGGPAAGIVDGSADPDAGGLLDGVGDPYADGASADPYGPPAHHPV